MRIREMEPEDAESVYNFWVKNYVVTERETPERIVIILQKNPGLSLVAEDDDIIVATVVATNDGRIGRLYKLVVREDLRGNGIGSKLAERSIKLLLEEGLLDIRIDCQKGLVDYYERLGFKVKDDDYLKMQIRKY